LWLLEPTRDATKQKSKHPVDGEYLPLALQWGRNMLHSADKARPQSFVLATLLSRLCALLEVDPVRDWNVDQPDTWGAMGHFSIANRATVGLSNRVKNLAKLIKANVEIIGHSDATLLKGDFTGMGTSDFVPMADVPDFFWKQGVAKQG